MNRANLPLTPACMRHSRRLFFPAFCLLFSTKLFAATLLFCACHSGGGKTDNDRKPAGGETPAGPPASAGTAAAAAGPDSSGPPNGEENYPGKAVVIYYFSSICTADKIVKGSDKSSIRVTFDEQKRYKGYDTRVE